MSAKPRSLLFAAALFAVPMAPALAQQSTNPPGNLGSNRSTTASPGTADSHAASGINTGDVGSRGTGTSNYGGAGMSSATPGSTGQTKVPGNNSTVAGNTTGTNTQQTTGNQTGSGGGAR